MHASELVQRGGHHGAFCTSSAETGHIHYNKKAAKYSRVRLSQNSTQDNMLKWVLRQRLWSAVVMRNSQLHPEQPRATCKDSTLLNRLDYTDKWRSDDLLRNPDRTPRRWGSTFLSKNVLVTRDELLTLMRTKLQMRPTLVNCRRLAVEFEWECYGAYRMYIPELGIHRKIVGISSLSPGRRDFVRLRGHENNTALCAQVENTYTITHIYVLYNTYVVCH